MHGGLVRIRQMWDKLTPSEEKIAEYILHYPIEAAELSVQELSQVSGGSPAAIIRLCKKLGVEGYKSLKLMIAGDLQDERVYGYQEIHPKVSISQLIQTVTNNNILSLRDTLKVLDPEMVARAIDAIDKAKRIYFYGVGASNLIANDAQYKFMRIKKTCFYFSDHHQQLASTALLDKEDLVIGISYSGETSHVMKCLQTAKELGSTTISLTKFGSSSISQYADIPLYITSMEGEIRSGATSSRITQLNLIDILYIGVISQNYESSLEYLQKTRIAMDSGNRN